MHVSSSILVHDKIKFCPKIDHNYLLNDCPIWKMWEFRTFIGLITALTIVPGFGIAYYYRPIGDHDEMDKKSGPKRSGFFISKQGLCDRADISPPLLYRLLSVIVIVGVTCLSRIFIYGCGKFKIKKDKNYANFLNQIRQRNPGVPLLTVCNHRSMADDPAMISSLLPFWMCLQLKNIRWGICTQNQLFTLKQSNVLHALAGLGRVMPIKSGAGINQKLLLDFARRLAAGDWGHVFPEAGIWQRPGCLGGRENGKEGEIGHLKWGVGKLIAHSPKRAIVIPFVHLGMETVTPQDPVTRARYSSLPNLIGHDVTVNFGDELSFDDLIKEHEDVHGILWKYTASVDDDKEGDFHEYWDSKPEEQELYHKITMRVEQALTALHRR